MPNVSEVMSHPHNASLCKDCGALFITSVEEEVWLVGNGLAPYKRCPDCRKKRKPVVVLCKDCGQEFSTNADEISWLVEKNLAPYKRCPDCRKIRIQRRIANGEPRISI